MKYLVVIFFSIAVLSQVFSDLLMYAAFKCNQDFITEKLCVNKDKPGKHCRGCCYMAKQIKKEKENEEKSTTGDFNKKAATFDLYCVSPEIIIAPSHSSNLIFTAKTLFITNPALLGVFHPPKPYTV